MAAAVAIAAACLAPATVAGAHAGDDDFDHAQADRVDAGSLRSPEPTTQTIDGQPAADSLMQSLGLPSHLVGDAPVTPDPAEVGTWSAPLTTPLVPVFAALLPNGKVLAWDYYDPALSPIVAGQESNTRAIVWDPADGSSTPVNVGDFNLFCAGFTHLPDGNLYVAGGQLNVAGDPIEQTHVFDWQSNTWSRGADMARKRWYPSVAAMSNGELLVLGGDPEGSHGQLGADRAEVRQLDGSLRSLAGMDTNSDRLYPFLAPMPDGRVLYAGWDPQMLLLDGAGDGSATPVGARDAVTRAYGSFAQLAPGEVLVGGGGSGTPGVSASGTTISFGDGMPATAPALAMARPRRHHYLTMLADGSVLATGGLGLGADDSLVDLDDADDYVKAAELWRPGATDWRELAAADKVRQYHSIAMLLPDGRVLTGGGGVCGRCQQAGYYENNFEIFTPPYLYTRDGSGQLAPRPTIAAAPDAIGYARTFDLQTAEASAIDKVALVKLGAPTHAVDQGQRYVQLSFAAAGDEALTVSQPANAYEAPPGYYMLFLIDTAGVPSVSKMVKVGAADDLFAHDGAPLRAYAAAGSDGPRQDFGRGVFRATRGHLADVGNDTISRLEVADGYRVLARDGSGGDGACKLLGPGGHDFGGTPLDDAISFLRVAPAGDLPDGFECPPPPGDTGATGSTGGSGPTVPAPVRPEVRIARVVRPARRPIVAFATCADGCQVTVRLSRRRRPLLRRSLSPSAKPRRLRFVLGARDLRRLRSATVRAKSRITVTAIGRQPPPVVRVARFARR